MYLKATMPMGTILLMEDMKRAYTTCRAQSGRLYFTSRYSRTNWPVEKQLKICDLDGWTGVCSLFSCMTLQSLETLLSYTL
jgi:hypothetical protein